MGGVNDRGTARRAGNVTPGPDWTSLQCDTLLCRKRRPRHHGNKHVAESVLT